MKNRQKLLEEMMRLAQELGRAEALLPRAQRDEYLGYFAEQSAGRTPAAGLFHAAKAMLDTLEGGNEG